MTRAEEKRFKRALQAKRAELTRESAETRSRLAIDPASDPMDQVRSVADRDFAVCSLDRMCAVLRQVEDALCEMRNGTFGVCARCDEEIPMKRLEAVPWSPYCIACQERAERDGRELDAYGMEVRYAVAC
jgi:DnaK suppressor protein